MCFISLHSLHTVIHPLWLTIDVWCCVLTLACKMSLNGECKQPAGAAPTVTSCALSSQETREYEVSI